MYKIELEKIWYIEGNDDYVKIHIADRKSIIARATLKNILEKLPQSLFIRVHRSFIVPRKNIKIVEQQHIVFGKERIPISKSFSDFLKTSGDVDDRSI